MKRLILALALFLLPSISWAQCNGVFSPNTICGTVAGGIPGQVPTSVLTGIPGGSAGQIEYNNSGAFGGFTMSGDCLTNTSTGVITCTKTSGVAFGPPATGTASGNTTKFGTVSGALVSGHCISTDANFNLIDSGGACSTSATNAGQCLTYTPIGGDNTAALNSALTTAIAGGFTLCLPSGTIQISGNWVWPSNTRIRGAGRDITIIQKTANTCCTMISAIGSSGTHITNIAVSDFTVDANSAGTSQAQYFTIATDFIDNFTMERMKFIHAYNGGHVFGSVTGGTPTVPNGWQTQTNFTFRDNIFDCSGGKVSPNSGDCVDILWTNHVLVENNTFQHSGVNGLSTEFNVNFLYIGNQFIDTAWGLYGETSQDGAVIGNQVYFGGNNAPAHSTSPLIGIWFPDANQTYVNGGYGGSQRVKFIGNSIHNQAVTTTATGSQGIVINAPSGSLAAQDLFISGNTFNGLQANTGVIAGVVLNGSMDTITVNNNVCRGFFNGTSQACIVASGSYTPPGMAAAQSSINMTFEGNVSDTVTPLQSPAPTCSVTGAGTGATCTVLVDSTDARGALTITAGTTAAGSGQVTLNIASSLGRSASQCITNLLQGTGWQGGSNSFIVSSAQTAPVFFWNNAGVALTNGNTYSLTYDCKGR